MRLQSLPGFLYPVCDMTKEKELQKEYTVLFKVRSYEVDRHGLATLSSICNYFQEAAGIHANHLHFDISQLQESGFTWVLYKMDVEVQRFPERWESVTVKTRPSSGDGLRALRDYELFDEHGARIAAAVSQWMVLNTTTRRPVRLPKEILNMGLTNSDHVIEPDTSPLPKVNPNKEIEQHLILTAGLNDLDMNGHVNNVKYIEWFTGHLPAGLTDGKSCREIKIQYISECSAGDRIFHFFESDKQRNRKKVVQSLYKNSSLELIATAVTYWH